MLQLLLCGSTGGSDPADLQDMQYEGEPYAEGDVMLEWLKAHGGMVGNSCGHTSGCYGQHKHVVICLKQCQSGQPGGGKCWHVDCCLLCAFGEGSETKWWWAFSILCDSVEAFAAGIQFIAQKEQ
jgi:hypothetical protein